MEAERGEIEKAFGAVFAREGLQVRRANLRVSAVRAPGRYVRKYWLRTRPKESGGKSKDQTDGHDEGNTSLHTFNIPG